MGFTNEALCGITTYRWPGNLRELRNAIERAVILSTGEKIGLGDLPLEASGRRNKRMPPPRLEN